MTKKEKEKIKPTPPPGKGGDAAKVAAGGSAAASAAREKNVTVFTSLLDPDLVTIDAYAGEFGKTINNLYDFSTTMDFGILSDMLQGGIGMLGKVTDALKQAKEIKDKVKNGDYLSALEQIAPGAKSALRGAGLDEKMVDNMLGAAQMAMNVKDTVTQISNGDLDILNGINALSQGILGQPLGIIEDIQGVIQAGSVIANEFSNAGVDLKNSWNDLVGGEGKNQKHFTNTNSEIFTNVYTTWTNTGDYGTMGVSIDMLQPNDVEKLKGDVVESLLSNFNMSSVFNAGKDPSTLFNEVMEVIYKLRGKSSLWYPRSDLRQGFNLSMFSKCSYDFKKCIKAALTDRFDFDATVNKPQLGYDDPENEVFMIMINLLNETVDTKNELRNHYPGVLTTETQNASDYVSPFFFVS